MSFTATVKSEVLNRIPTSGCCMHSFFAGMASVGGVCKIEKNGISYIFSTENPDIGDAFENLCKTLFFITHIFVAIQSKLRKQVNIHKTYIKREKRQQQCQNLCINQNQRNNQIY